MFEEIIGKLLVYLALIAQIIIVTILILLLFEKYRKILFDLIDKNVLWLSFVIALIASLGSLFYSEIKGYDPCKLCWYQRIFMYPQVFLMGFAMLKKELFILRYSLILILAGGLISLYHNYIYYFPAKEAVCSVAGGGVSCTVRYIIGFGYMTIPLMSLTAFVLLLVFHIVALRKRDSGA